MSKFARAATIAVALTALAGASQALAVSKGAAPLRASSGVSVTSSAECSKPVNGRAGGWFCVDESQLAERLQTTCGQWNGYNGCWTRDASFKDHFSGTGTYGYGSQTIGTATITFTDMITGYSFSSNQVSVRSTHSMTAVNIGTVRSKLANGSSGAPGTNIAGTDRSSGNLGNATAGTTKSANVVVGYDNTASYLSVSHKPSWGTAGFPGRWYYGAKSLMMYKSGQYLFYADERRPAQEIYVGWS